jgi:hypothetical protein
MMGILGIFMPGGRATVEEKRAAYDELQGLLENVAMEIKKKAGRNEGDGCEPVLQEDGADRVEEDHSEEAEAARLDLERD